MRVNELKDTANGVHGAPSKIPDLQFHLDRLEKLEMIQILAVLNEERELLKGSHQCNRHNFQDFHKFSLNTPSPSRDSRYKVGCVFSMVFCPNSL